MLPVVGAVHVRVRVEPLTLAETAVGASGAAGAAVTVNCTERPTGDSASRATSPIDAEPVAPVTGATVTSNVRLVEVDPVGVMVMPALVTTAALVDVAVSVRVAPAVSTSVTVTGNVVGVETTVEIAVGTPGAYAGTSSTAVTLTFSRRSVESGGERQTDALATGIVLAWAVMFARVAVEVAVVHPPLLRAVLLPLAAMLVVGSAAAAAFYRSSRRTPEEAQDVALRNPFSLTAAIRFAGVFLLVLLAVAIVQRWAPGRGELVVAAIAGLTDVDAITLSMATFARDGGAATTATQAIIVATFTNTIVKCGLVVGLASPALRTRVVAVTVAVVAAGSAALLLA